MEVVGASLKLKEVALIEGGCRSSESGASRVDSVDLVVNQDKDNPRVFVARLGRFKTSHDSFGCASSSPVGAWFTRNAVQAVKVTSLPEDGADVSLGYQDGKTSKSVGATNAPFSVPYAPPSENAVFYIAKKGFYPCVRSMVLDGRANASLVCELVPLPRK